MKNTGRFVSIVALSSGLVVGAFANPLTDLANDTGSGAITGAGELMAGPIGYVVYFVIGLALVSLVIGGIKKFI